MDFDLKTGDSDELVTGHLPSFGLSDIPSSELGLFLPVAELPGLLLPDGLKNDLIQVKTRINPGCNVRGYDLGTLAISLVVAFILLASNGP